MTSSPGQWIFIDPVGCHFGGLTLADAISDLRNTIRENGGKWLGITEADLHEPTERDEEYGWYAIRLEERSDCTTRFERVALP